jgi:hypothetical protein
MATGYGMNVAPNTIFLAAFLAPILRSGVLGTAARTGREVHAR